MPILNTPTFSPRHTDASYKTNINLISMLSKHVSVFEWSVDLVTSKKNAVQGIDVDFDLTWFG